MMRSMYSGISGLRAHQIHMDVIGNNIANVNTVGFKSSRVTFQEIYNQTLKSAEAPSQVGERGGINPHQIGLGISVASIDVLHSRGSVQRTDKATDLAIDGVVEEVHFQEILNAALQSEPIMTSLVKKVIKNIVK